MGFTIILTSWVAPKMSSNIFQQTTVCLDRRFMAQLLFLPSNWDLTYLQHQKPTSEDIEVEETPGPAACGWFSFE